jgi:hypothetical protein
MPVVLLVAAAVAAIGVLAYKKPGTVVAQPIVTENNGSNGGTGITTGFAPPPIQSTVSAPTPSPVQKNIPSSSASGVPNYSSNTQEFAVGPANPSPGYPQPQFYMSNQGPISRAMQTSTKPTKTSNCGCGGGSHSNPSDCATAAARNRDGGCLAPTRRSLVNSAPPGVIATWAANIKSAGVTPWDGIQQAGFDAQESNSYNETTVPAAPNLTGIGLSYRRGFRSSVKTS